MGPHWYMVCSGCSDLRQKLQKGLGYLVTTLPLELKTLRTWPLFLFIQGQKSDVRCSLVTLPFRSCKIRSRGATRKMLYSWRKTEGLQSGISASAEDELTQQPPGSHPQDFRSPAFSAEMMPSTALKSSLASNEKAFCAS